MRGDEFIASPLAICHSITEENQEKAKRQIARCPRCGDEHNTRPDVLICSQSKVCYQILFECLSCNLRLDIYDNDYFKLDDYKPLRSNADACGTPTTSSDVDLRMGQNGFSSSATTNGKPKIQILLHNKSLAKNTASTLNGTNGLSQNEEGRGKIKISIGVKRPLGPTALSALNEDNEPEPFKKADEQYAVRKEVESSKNLIGETVRKQMEAERLKRLEKEAEFKLYLLMNKESLERRAEAEKALAPLVTELQKRLQKNNYVHDWTMFLPECKDPDSLYGYNIKKIIAHQRVYLKYLYCKNSVPMRQGGELDLELARDFQYQKREEMLAEMEVHLKEAFEEDLKKSNPES